jgi:P-type Ca2+ transporter type 2C
MHRTYASIQYCDMKHTDFYKQSIQFTEKYFNTSLGNGLSDEQVVSSRERFGTNKINQSKKRSLFKLFASQFKDILILVLIVAAIVSLGLSVFSTHTKTLTGEEKVAHYSGICDEWYETRQNELNSSDSSDINRNICDAVRTNSVNNLENPKIEVNESPTESLLIFSIVIAIAIVGFLNEYKAEKTVEALRKLVGFKAKVRRNGKLVEIDSTELVAGDIVIIEEGQKVSADIRIAEARSLRINEASLTGESLPVGKDTDEIENTASLGDQTNMLFSGTIINGGTGIGIVTSVGNDTEIGKIARLVSDVDEELTPMQKKLDALGRQLGIGVLLICAVVFLAIFAFDNDISDVQLAQRLIIAFTAAVALAVAAIPEGLAFVVRISLALGARRMATKNALVRKLSAVEALGSTDVICSDKTGTLTRGEMTVRQVWYNRSNYHLSGSGYDTDGQFSVNKKTVSGSQLLQILKIGALCNNAGLNDSGGIIGDPTEASLLVALHKAGADHLKIQSDYKRINEIPFSSERKMMTTIHNFENKYIVAVKGAPEVVLDKCKQIYVNGQIVELTPELKDTILNQNHSLATNALRVLGVAYKQTDIEPVTEDSEQSLIFLGLIGMMDPPREEIIDVVKRVQEEAGMRVIMITGDFIETAKSVATEIGIHGEAISGVELDKLSNEEFENRVESIGVYGRVNPEHKIRIVQALKRHGHQVAMTGDGVNDSPAIKAADIGIAMGITGTDATKEAADLILLDDKFLTIISAIEEGRGIFDNVRKFVNYLLSANVAEVVTILFGVLFFNSLVLTAAQLLFINIVTDGLPAVALGSDPAEKNIMRFKPARFQEKIVHSRMWIEMFIFGLLMSGVLLWLYWYNGLHHSTLAVSSAFTAMVIFEMVRLIDIRTDYKIKWFSNPWLSVAIAGSLFLQVSVLYFKPLANVFGVAPIDTFNWLVIVMGSIGLITFMKLMNPILDRFVPER